MSDGDLGVIRRRRRRRTRSRLARGAPHRPPARAAAAETRPRHDASATTSTTTEQGTPARCRWPRPPTSSRGVTDRRDGQRAGELLAGRVQRGGPQQGHDLEHDPGDHGDGGKPADHRRPRRGRGVQEHEREEDEPPDEAACPPELRRVSSAGASRSPTRPSVGVVVAERAPGHRGPKPEECPSGRWSGARPVTTTPTSQHGEHGSDYQGVGETG